MFPQKDIVKHGTIERCLEKGDLVTIEFKLGKETLQNSLLVNYIDQDIISLGKHTYDFATKK
jgi:hypothetical protein